MAQELGTKTTTTPRAWTEWVNLLAGIWLFISPWLLRAVAGGTPSWNDWVLGVVFVVAALISFAVKRFEWVNVAAAVWLFISPWVLGFSTFGYAWNAWIVALIVFVVGISGAVQPERATAHV